MLKFNYLLIFILLNFIFLGCNNHTNNSLENKCPIYKLEIDNVTSLDITNIADLSAIIPLETSEQSIIGDIKRVFFVDSLLLVWDGKMQNLLLFNKEGDFKYPIGQIGSAPNEYQNITDVYLTPENMIQVLDNRSRRILTFDITGKFIESQNLKYHLYSFFSSKDGIWGVNSFQNKHNYFLIHTPSLSEEIDKGYFPNKTRLLLKQTNNFSFNTKNDEVLFHYPYDDNIYILKNDSLLPFICIDFGDKKGPYNYYDKSENLEDKMYLNDYLGEIHNLHTYGEHLFFSFYRRRASDPNIDNYNVYISTKEQNVKIFQYDIKHPNEIKISPLPKIINISNNKLIFQIIPEILSPSLFDELSDMIPEDIKPDSNPILVVYQLKE